MTLVEEASLAFEPEVDRFPVWVRVATKVARKKQGRCPQGQDPALPVLRRFEQRVEFIEVRGLRQGVESASIGDLACGRKECTPRHSR
jgi:hypothetical protein